MSYKIDLILENIALEIITGGVSTANVMISSGKFWPKLMSMYTSLWRYISVFVSNSVKYGAGNYNGR